MTCKQFPHLSSRLSLSTSESVAIWFENPCVYSKLWADARLASLVRNPAFVIMPAGSGLILVVDNDPQDRTAIVNALRAQGHLAVEIVSPHKVLEFIQRRPSRVQLLITGVVFPGLSGLDLAARVRRCAFGAKIIYLSAPEDPVAVNGVLHPASDFLKKPFTAEELVAKVAAVLNTSPTVHSSLRSNDSEIAPQSQDQNLLGIGF